MGAGHGLIVMLANTGAGSIITAAQTGAYTGKGHALLGPHVALILILYILHHILHRDVTYIAVTIRRHC